MLRRLHITKWGNGYGMRLPSLLLSELGAQDGDRVDVHVTQGTLVLRVIPRQGVPDGAQPTADFESVQRVMQSVLDDVDRLAVMLERRECDSK
jgi:antitoxin component of MazEF toxin-antitoxin module